MLQGRGGKAGAALTGDYQALGMPRVGKRLQSRTFPPTLSGKFSRTAHVEVIFLVLSCLIGSEISTVKNYLKTSFMRPPTV